MLYVTTNSLTRLRSSAAGTKHYTMRTSLSSFIDTCFDIKCHLAVGSYELHDYSDGSFADFKVSAINDPVTLLNLMNGLSCRILAGDGVIIVRVFENFEEY